MLFNSIVYVVLYSAPHYPAVAAPRSNAPIIIILSDPTPPTPLPRCCLHVPALPNQGWGKAGRVSQSTYASPALETKAAPPAIVYLNSILLLFMQISTYGQFDLRPTCLSELGLVPTRGLTVLPKAPKEIEFSRVLFSFVV